MVQERYNSNKYGKATGLRFPDKDPVTGKYLPHGNGCSFFNNCFVCPEKPNKCHYGNNRSRKMEGN